MFVSLQNGRLDIT